MGKGKGDILWNLLDADNPKPLPNTVPDLAADLFGADAPVVALAALPPEPEPEVAAARERFADAHKRWLSAGQQVHIVRGRQRELADQIAAGEAECASFDEKRKSGLHWLDRYKQEKKAERVEKGTAYVADLEQQIRQAATRLSEQRAQLTHLGHNLTDFESWETRASEDMDAAEADIKRLLGVTDASYLCPWCGVLVQQANSVQHARACWGVQVQTTGEAGP